MTFLDEIITKYIWITTLTIVLISIFTFSGIILKRYIDEVQEKKEYKKRLDIEKILLTHISMPLHNIKSILIKNKKDIEIIAKTAPVLLHNLKGNSYIYLIDTFNEIGLYDWIKESLIGNDSKKLELAITLTPHWSNEEIKNIILKLLENNNFSLRYVALEFLAATKDISLLSYIVNEIKKEDNFSSLLVYDIFNKFGATISHELASIAIDSRSSFNIKMAALIALGKTGDIKTIKKIAIPFCTDDNFLARLHAYRALANSKETISEGLLKLGAQDSHWQVRIAVVDCITNTTPLPIDILTKLLEDESYLVGWKAGKALALAGDVGKNILSKLSKKNKLVASRVELMLEEKRSSYGMV